MKDLEQEFIRLEQIQQNIYHSFTRQQQLRLAILQEEREAQEREQLRRKNMKQRSSAETITHPNNGHLWIPLAHIITESHDSLAEVQQRQRQRQNIRNAMTAKHQIAEQQTQGDESQEEGATATKTNKNKKREKADWKLMRELRKQEVRENKQRLARIEENRKIKMDNYHKY